MYCNIYNTIVKTTSLGCHIVSFKDIRGRNKHKYTQEEAFRALELFNKRGKAPWEIYHCQQCLYWHLGRRSSKTQRIVQQEQLAMDILELGRRVAKKLRAENSDIGYFYICKLSEQHFQAVERRERYIARKKARKQHLENYRHKHQLHQ